MCNIIIYQCIYILYTLIHIIIIIVLTLFVALFFSSLRGTVAQYLVSLLSYLYITL